jgi:hypothetical protein
MARADGPGAPPGGRSDEAAPGLVFISHSTADRRAADAICGALEDAGIPCWIAPRNVEPGKDWASEIMSGLAASRLMVLVVSASAQESADVGRELERAAAQKVPIVPFRIDGVALTPAFQYFLAKVQWLDAQSGPLEDRLSDLTGVVQRALAGGRTRRARLTGGARTLLDLPPVRWARALVAWIGLKWIGIGTLVLAAVILHQIRRPVDLTLHATTERVSFSLIGSDPTVDVMRGLPLASLTLRGARDLRLPVVALREAGKPLIRPGQEGKLEAQDGEPNLVMRGMHDTDELRLERLALASGSRLVLYADRGGQVILDAEARGSQIEVGVIGEGRLLLRAKDLVLVGKRGESIEFAIPGPEHHLEARPQSRNIILEPGSEGRFTLVLDPSGRSGEAEGGGLPLPFAPRLQITALDFPPRQDGRRAIRHLWVHPVVPRDRALGRVFVDVPKSVEFRLESARASGEALECDLAGKPQSLMVGESPPGAELVPSVLTYLLNHVVYRTVCKPIGLC